jgi:hypothetical protein
MAESLIALMNGERGSKSAQDGALLLAEGLLNLRDCADFARGYAKALSRRKMTV